MLKEQPLEIVSPFMAKGIFSTPVIVLVEARSDSAVGFVNSAARSNICSSFDVRLNKVTRNHSSKLRTAH